jgi:MurNAc alpha-1-phosphate uridylyltransferase
MSNKKPDKAFIFAAGLGTRMHPLTKETPKPLIKVAGKALIDYQIEMILNAGIKQIAINSFYLSEQINGHIQKYLQMGIDIKIFNETERLETGGGLINALSFINYEPIFTLNSDVIFIYSKNPILRLLENWKPDNHDALMVVAEKEKTLGFYETGNFDIDKNGLLSKNNDCSYIFTGLEIINTEVLKNYSDKKIFSLSEVFNNLSISNRLSGIIHDNLWLHVGDLKGLDEAENFLKNK